MKWLVQWQSRLFNTFGPSIEEQDFCCLRSHVYTMSKFLSAERSQHGNHRQIMVSTESFRNTIEIKLRKNVEIDGKWGIL